MYDQEVESEPAHHARRPMNAFLIFCKRHRSVVRDKYPNLENRSITKILGEWWANLDKEEKACYTGLAKQYKDAFFSANPDFKWYKLPAPPLRTLSSRPRDVIDKPTVPPHPEHHEIELERTNNNSTRVDLNKRPQTVTVPYEHEPKLSMFTPGKLADEAQMGGLSSLLATKTEPQSPNPYYSPPSFKYSTISNTNEITSHNLDRSKVKREDSIRELQNALTETTRVFKEDFDAKAVYVRDPQNEFTNQDVIDQIVDKRFCGDEYYRNGSDDERMKSGRSCKGKRYQEFMAVGGLIVNKRPKREYNDRTDEAYNAACSWESNQSCSDDSKNAEAEGIDPNEALETDNNTNKTFKAADFDLDAKIKALPSLSLEKFQQRKRENKRKKKSIGVRHQSSPVIINTVPRPAIDERREMAEHWRETVIGSQKRKPRKISITRLEINSCVTSVDSNRTHKISPEIKIATEAPCTVQSMDMCKQEPHAVDLLALATLAEVASNTSKLEDSSMANIGNASEGNASMV